jgi:hypothetical protein
MVRKIGSAGLILAVAAACGDSAGPEDFSPVDTQEKADLVLSAFDGNLALQSFAVLGGAFNFSGAALALATLPAEPNAFGPATAARLRALAPSFSSAAPEVIFPADILGTTWVYDPDLGEYVEDEGATGAPADGVRLILYAVNPVLGQVLLPLDEVGYLDLIDESTASADQLRIVAVVNNVTNLDYVASATTTTNSVTLSAAGFVANGTDQVDFDLTFRVTQTGLTIDYQLESDDGAVRLQAVITGEDSGTLTLTISDGDDTVVFAATFSPSTATGQITYNGEEVVVISGDGDDLTFERPDGTPLSNAEIAALNDIGDLIGDLFDAFDVLLIPALIVFAIT